MALTPFHYEGYTSPYVQSISDLLQEPGRAQAAAIQQIGQVRAHAAQQSGQAWAGAGQQIAQEVGSIPQQIQQHGMQQLQLAHLAAQTDEIRAQATARQKAEQDQAALSNAIKQSLKPDGTVDYEKAANLTEQAGAPGLANQYREAALKMQASRETIIKGQREADTAAQNAQIAAQDRLGEFALSAVKSMEGAKDPLAARDIGLAHVAVAATDGLIPQNQAKQLLMQASKASSPDEVKAVFQQFITPTVAERATKQGLIEAETAKNLAEAKKANEPTSKSLQSKSVLVDGKPAEVSYNPVDGSYQQGGQPIEASRVKPIPPASMTINPALVPSGDALEMAAKRYLATGELPSMGMGQAGAAARVAVMNAAAKIDPTASLAANKAAFKADSANLTKLQTTEGTLSAFEKTAGKNLDQFLSLADKIPDTGVPWLNQPIRSVNASGLGSADQAAFNAARDVALREIARVTNDPKLSGSLTDSARAEVSGLSPANATFAQIKAVAKVLKQDMANVHAGINDQIAAVKTGLQGNPAATTSSASVKMKAPNGQVSTVPADQVDHFKSLGATVVP